MNRTMVKSKNDPKVVHVNQDKHIRTIDNEVATLLGASTSA